MAHSVSKDGEGITIDHCRCCYRTFPSGTLNLLGFYMVACDNCLNHYYVMGAYKAPPCRELSPQAQ